VALSSVYDFADPAAPTTLPSMSEQTGWDAEERVVDWDEMFGDVLPEQTGDDLVDRDTASTGGGGDAGRDEEFLANRPPHYED
jgi:hypothetical protein